MSSSIPNEFAETAEIPFRPARMVELLRLHRHPESSPEDTMRYLIDMMKREVEDLQSSHLDDDLAVVAATYEKLKVDSERRSRSKTLELLRSMPRDVVDALIEGTYGHRYSTQEDFRDQVMEIDNCAGIYINTWVKEGTGKGLTSQEWGMVQEAMDEYIASEGVKLDPAHATDKEREMVERAIKISEAVERYTFPDEDAIRNAWSGVRRFIQGQGMAKSHCDMMSKRMRPDLDPTGVIRQLQSSAHVGCSEDMAGCVVAYPLKSSARSGFPLTWKLFLCVCEALDLKVTHICKPVLKIWDSEQLSLGEILISVLAGSLMQWGGFNPDPPGNKHADPRRSYHEEMKQVFVQSNVARSNMLASIKQMKERKSMIESISKMDDPEPLDARIKNVIKDVERLDVKTKIDEAIEKNEARTAMLQAKLVEMNKRLEELERVKSFRERMKAFKDGTA